MPIVALVQMLCRLHSWVCGTAVKPIKATIFAAISTFAPLTIRFTFCGLHTATGCFIWFRSEVFSLNVIIPWQVIAVQCFILWDSYLEGFTAFLSLSEFIYFNKAFVKLATCRYEFLNILWIMFFVYISYEYIIIHCSI